MRLLLALFETRVADALKAGALAQDPPLTDFFKPRLSLMPLLVKYTLAHGFPKLLLEHQGLASDSEALESLFTHLFHQHYSESLLRTPRAGHDVLATWDFSRPADWYPQTRKMKRKIFMHVGPTNSGKTHASLQALAKGRSGYYAGPLRLLAREIYERFNAQGIDCNLITGEEVIPALDRFGNVSKLSLGTIEMIPLAHKMDICIIDEIQMIADEARGAAWTSAVLGVQAKEIHLCGEASAVNLIRKLVEHTGDDLEVKYYDRLGKLSISPQAVESVGNLRKGDCIVVFSQRKILEIKCEIEQATKLRVGVIYGALPPEIRSFEARQFNNGDYDVLVASDAIGMGLNLKIKRIVFWKTVKFNGSEMVDLSVSATKQIAGRAGRFSQDVGELEGFVTTFHRKDLRFLDRRMKEQIPDLTHACIWPPNAFWSEYVASFAQYKTLRYAVRYFYKTLEPSKLNNFCLADFEHQTQIIELLHHEKFLDRLTVDDTLQLAQTPVNLQMASSAVIDSTIAYLECIALRDCKSVFEFGFLPQEILESAPNSERSTDSILATLGELETSHKLVLVFMWLSQRWPTIFVDRESASEVKTLIEKRISEELASLRKATQARKQQKRKGRGRAGKS